MKRLILAVATAGLLSACQCGPDLYRSSYEIPKVFCWEDYGERDTCSQRPCQTTTCRTRPVYIQNTYIRIYLRDHCRSCR